MTMPSRITTELKEGLSDLAFKAQEHATKNYIPFKDHNGQINYQPKYVDRKNWLPFEDSYTNASTRLDFNSLSQANIALFTFANQKNGGDKILAAKEIGKHLQENFGEASYSFLSTGSTTMTFLRKPTNSEKVSVIRISSRLNENTNETVGSASPYLSTAFNKAQIGIFLNISETEPLSLMPLKYTDNKEKLSGNYFHEFQKLLFTETCFEPSKIYEIGVKSDGALMIFDPGEAKYTKKFLQMDSLSQKQFLAQSFKTLKQRLNSYDISPVFNPYKTTNTSKNMPAMPNTA